MDTETGEELEIDSWSLDDEIELFYKTNMVANETLANIEAMDAMTKQQKQMKQQVLDRCWIMLDKSTEYFMEMISQLDILREEDADG
jgi:hypothetical protein